MKSLIYTISFRRRKRAEGGFFFFFFVDDVMSSRKVGDARHSSEDRGMYGSRGFCR